MPLGNQDADREEQGEHLGKPYDSELASLPLTYDWARSADIKPLVAASRRASALPLIAIGSGGSLQRPHSRRTAISISAGGWQRPSRRWN